MDITTGKVTPSASEAKCPPGSLADAIEDAQRMLADTPQKYGGHKPSARSDQGGELDDLIRHLNEIRLRMIDRGEYVTNEWADVADATTIGIAIDSLRARSPSTPVDQGGERVSDADLLHWINECQKAHGSDAARDARMKRGVAWGLLLRALRELKSLRARSSVSAGGERGLGAPGDTREVLAELTSLRDFMCGEGSHKGLWFGEPNPHIKGNFWWRRWLRPAIDRAIATLSRSSGVGGETKTEDGE